MLLVSYHNCRVPGRCLLLCWSIALGVFSTFFLPIAFAEDRFSWNHDSLFHQLESAFVELRQQPKAAVENKFDRSIKAGDALLQEIAASNAIVPSEKLQQLERVQFDITMLAAVLSSRLTDAREFITRSRIAVLKAAQSWPYSDEAVHEQLYRIIYGGRAAMEEALAQTDGQQIEPVFSLGNVESAAPYAVVRGVKIYSGDLLLSRGGAPTSALIARGNHFPGQFSHVAMVYVDPKTKEPLVIEALIEKGVVVTTAEEYLGRVSLRIMVLRLRPDEPALIADPLVAHKAATHALQLARSSQLPYDFAMAWQDDSAFFCSEVVYHAYRKVGIDLWAYKGQVKAPGLKALLGQLGVRHFTMIIPSDLEYDPRLVPVNEWLKIDTLKEDRYDSAILDALLEAAEDGYRLSYPWYELPLASVVKGWSMMTDAIGAGAKIPKGMSSSTALRVHSLTETIHPVLKESVKKKAAEFHAQHGYEPPYWQLFTMSKHALNEHHSDFSAVLKKEK